MRVALTHVAGMVLVGAAGVYFNLPLLWCAFLAFAGGAGTSWILNH